MATKAVGVKALRDGLSRYLRDVRAGTTILVLDRDEVVAEIRQPSVDAYPGAHTTLADDLARSGKLIRARSPRSKLRPSPLRLPTGSAQEILEADRADSDPSLR